MPGKGDDEQDIPRTWDRVGSYWSGVAAVSQGIAERNVQLWNVVSSNLRSKKSYGADDLTTDVARAWTTALDNLDDLWTLATRPPDPQQAAATLPTVFLDFFRVEEQWSVCDAVWIRAPFWQKDDLPPTATIELAGDREGVDALKACIKVERRDDAYLLTVADVEGLVVGFYDGIVVADGHPLAGLRVLVREKDT